MAVPENETTNTTYNENEDSSSSCDENSGDEADFDLNEAFDDVVHIDTFYIQQALESNNKEYRAAEYQRGYNIGVILWLDCFACSNF